MSGVDLERLTSLRDDIGAEDFADVVLLFFSEIGEKLEQMRAEPETLSEGDFHFLRGSAANLGFTEMARACAAAEAACTAGSDPDLKAVTASFDAAQALARAEVPELSAA
jgi:HPt (histidine-containing phosphotransfer) domain-containing protein